MRLLKITAPLTALAVLIGACGPTKTTTVPNPTLSDPLPSVSPAGGPALKRVWHTPVGLPVNVVGNVVVAQDPNGRGNDVIFIDGTTGRITGRAAVGELAAGRLSPATDGAGRPLVAFHDNASGKESVYGTNGRLAWKAHNDYQSFAGGYTVEPRGPEERPRAVVRTRTGSTVAGLPLSPYYHHELESGIGLQTVRPGLLVVSSFGTYSSQIALLDVSRPGRARVTVLHMPFKPNIDTTEPKVVVSGEHLYVCWWNTSDLDTGKKTPPSIARYDVPGARPVWFRHAPKGVDADDESDADIQLFPATNGGAEALAISSDEKVDSPRFLILNPATGKPIGPPNGRGGDLAFVSGGRAYVGDDGGTKTSTNAIDLRTGAVRTIDTELAGVTPDGDLIDADGSAYRWTN